MAMRIKCNYGKFLMVFFFAIPLICSLTGCTVTGDDLLDELTAVSVSFEDLAESDGDYALDVKLQNDSGMDIHYGYDFYLYYNTGLGWEEEKAKPWAVQGTAIILENGMAETVTYQLSTKYDVRPGVEYFFVIEIGEHDTDGVHEAYSHGFIFTAE